MSEESKEEKQGPLTIQQAMTVSLKPGSKILFRLPDCATKDQVVMFCRLANKKFGEENVFIFCGNVEVAVVEKDEPPAEMLKQLDQSQGDPVWVEEAEGKPAKKLDALSVAEEGQAEYGEDSHD